MTTQSIRLKIRSPSLKLKALPRFPASISGGTGIDVNAIGAGALSVALDLLQFGVVTSFDPSAEFLTIVDGNGVYQRVSVASLIGNFATNVRTVTEAGDITVGLNTQLLIMNRTADESPSNIILPLSSAKVGKIKIVDFKGNAGSFPHTVKRTSPDTFQGTLTQWSIAADGASIVLDPIPGTGYAV